MSGSALADAFAHHSWANLRLIDVCMGLTPDQLATSVPGTYGSILDTIRHTVGGDASYLHLLTGGAVSQIDDETMTLDELRVAAAEHGAAWQPLVRGHVDADEDVIRYRDDGTQSHAPRGLRLAQALHHGTDHRSQICTALTTLGMEPPAIDAWEFGRQDGRAFVKPAQA